MLIIFVRNVVVNFVADGYGCVNRNGKYAQVETEGGGETRLLKNEIKKLAIDEPVPIRWTTLLSEFDFFLFQVPPDRMTVVYNGGTEIGGDGTRHYVVGPVPEGGQMVLVCRVLGGKDKLTGFSFRNPEFSSCVSIRAR